VCLPTNSLLRSSHSFPARATLSSTKYAADPSKGDLPLFPELQLKTCLGGFESNSVGLTPRCVHVYVGDCRRRGSWLSLAPNSPCAPPLSRSSDCPFPSSVSLHLFFLLAPRPFASSPRRDAPSAILGHRSATRLGLCVGFLSPTSSPRLLLYGNLKNLGRYLKALSFHRRVQCLFL
jgi:hypothetical protein